MERMRICLRWLEAQSETLTAYASVHARVIPLNWLAFCHPDVFLDTRGKKEEIRRATLLPANGDIEDAAAIKQLADVLQWLRGEWLKLLKRPSEEFRAIHAEASSVENPIWRLLHKPSVEAAREANSWAVWKLSGAVPDLPKSASTDSTPGDLLTMLDFVKSKVKRASLAASRKDRFERYCTRNEMKPTPAIPGRKAEKGRSPQPAQYKREDLEACWQRFTEGMKPGELA